MYDIVHVPVKYPGAYFGKHLGYGNINNIKYGIKYLETFWTN